MITDILRYRVGFHRLEEARDGHEAALAREQLEMQALLGPLRQRLGRKPVRPDDAQDELDVLCKIRRHQEGFISTCLRGK